MLKRWRGRTKCTWVNLCRKYYSLSSNTSVTTKAFSHHNETHFPRSEFTPALRVSRSFPLVVDNHWDMRKIVRASHHLCYITPLTMKQMGLIPLNGADIFTRQLVIQVLHSGVVHRCGVPLPNTLVRTFYELGPHLALNTRRRWLYRKQQIRC
uniref:WGS project CAEQ00000000 data, annotated contig 1708 n=1 Tax=Trypanosoma congolense (strain IL3000) TaxID=1068625 RepID=F9W859_TRYCI|nr:unnamed protein product [Trypanosoma congolense IL3000]